MSNLEDHDQISEQYIYENMIIGLVTDPKSLFRTLSPYIWFILFCHAQKYEHVYKICLPLRFEECSDPPKFKS